VQTERMQYKLLCAVSAASFLALLLLLFIAGDFVRIVYGEKWLPSVPPLRAMILGAFTSTISLVLYSLCAAGNLVGRLARLGSVQLVLTIAVVLAAAPLGLLAVAAGIALRDLAMLLLLERVAARSHLSVSWRGILHALAPVLIATAVGALAGLVVLGLMGSMTPGAGILRPVGVVAGICAGYLSALLLCARLWPGHEPLAATLGFALHYARRVLPVRRQADAV